VQTLAHLLLCLAKQTPTHIVSCQHALDVLMSVMRRRKKGADVSEVSAGSDDSSALSDSPGGKNGGVKGSTGPAQGVLLALLLIRLSAAWFSGISDCDETFNYWEPIHFLAFGRGTQTWEYSPEYGLRSYAFLMPYYAVVALLKALGTHKVVIFYLVRGVCAVVTWACERHLLMATHKHVHEDVARVLAIFLAVSPGMWHAGVALLPQTFVMWTLTLAWGFWMKGYVCVCVCVCV
jgi:hypothetical protein